MDAVKFFEIIKKYNIIKDNSCERFELVGDDFDVNQFRVEWDNRCNPQEMMIYIGSESYIFIKIKQGVLKSDYELNTPPAKAGGFTVATKVAFRLKPVWPLLKQAEVIPPQFGRFHLHLPVA